MMSKNYFFFNVEGMVIIALKYLYWSEKDKISINFLLNLRCSKML